MTNPHPQALARIAMRQRREWLLSTVAATTLFASWYFSAALDARDAHGDGSALASQYSVSTAFDAAFVAANDIDMSTTLACAELTCATQLAQNESLKAQL